MREWDAFQGVIENYSNNLDNQSKLIYMLLILGGINLISGVANIIIQFKLQSRESKVHGKNIKEEQSIAIQLELYKKLQEIAYIPNNPNLLLTKVKEAEKYVNLNNLYIPKDLKKVSQELCDYYKIIMTDWRKKDYNKETNFLERYKTVFHK